MQCPNHVVSNESQIGKVERELVHPHLPSTGLVRTCSIAILFVLLEKRREEKRRALVSEKESLSSSSLLASLSVASANALGFGLWFELNPLG